MSDVIDAQFKETPNLAVQGEGAKALSLTSAAPNAETMVAALHEWERFKALAIRDNAWMSIPGVKGKYLPAAEVDRIAPAVIRSLKMVSHNEHGDIGVRAALVESLTYETKKVKRWNKYEKRQEDVDVPDHTKPVKTLAMVYSVTVEAVDCFGRAKTGEGSYSSLEGTKSDYHSRQQAITRAERRAVLKLIGGVDENVFEEERARIESEKRSTAEQAAKVPSGGQLFQRAKELKLVTDGPSFRAWASAMVPGCETANEDGWQPSLEQRVAIAAVLEWVV